jgi:putative transposase
MLLFQLAAALFRSLFLPRSVLLLENIALRHQLSVLQRTAKRPRLKQSDRIFWVWLSQIWPDWRSCLVIVKPQAVIRWHRQGFQLDWRWRSRPKRARRPRIGREIRDLIRRMSIENPTWGAPHIGDELQLLGYHVTKSAVATYMVRRRKPPSQTWRSFLKNHVRDIAAIDFFTVPISTFRMLYGFVVFRHDWRRLVHFNVTTNPTSVWTAQQMVEAFPFNDTPKYLIRDRDCTYAHDFQQRLMRMEIKEVVISPRSPWQNPFVERVIGSIRRECLDHVIVLSKAHLIRILAEYIDYYHTARPHQSLDHNAPLQRDIEPPEQGRVVAEPVLGGVHHRYRLAA